MLHPRNQVDLGDETRDISQRSSEKLSNMDGLIHPGEKYNTSLSLLGTVVTTSHSNADELRIVSISCRSSCSRLNAEVQVMRVPNSVYMMAPTYGGRKASDLTR